MKRDIYAYITTCVLILAVGFSAFLVYTDNAIPFTTQATVKTTSVDVVPEVKGYITDVFVREGQSVQAGTPLMQIERTDYQIAKDKALAVQKQRQNTLAKSERHYQRIRALAKSGSISQDDLDVAKETRANASTQLDQANADLATAKRNLDHTLIVAKHAGVVTNLAIKPGMYITPASVAVHLVNRQDLWVAADFTEKGLPALEQNSQVNIVFDALPKRVFQGQIISVDQAIQSGINDASQLAQVSSETRWIRSQQKVRVRIHLDAMPKNVVAGGRASVMLRDEGKVSDTWMTLLSWLRYLY